MLKYAQNQTCITHIAPYLASWLKDSDIERGRINLNVHEDIFDHCTCQCQVR